MNVRETINDLMRAPNAVSLLITNNYHRDVRDLKTYFSGHNGGFYKCEYSMKVHPAKGYLKIYIFNKLRLIVKPSRTIPLDRRFT